MLEALSSWLAATWLSQLFQSTLWFVPVVQSIHILAIALTLTLIGFVDLQLLGVARSGVSAPETAVGSLPWAWIGMLVLLVSGLLLTITEPARELTNVLFQLKMLLVVMLAVITAWLGSAMKREPHRWAEAVPVYGKIGASLSLALLVVIVVCGRWIAYVL